MTEYKRTKRDIKIIYDPVKENTLDYECPSCGEWMHLNKKQFKGEKSCKCKNKNCDYEETLPFIILHPLRRSVYHGPKVSDS